MAAKAKTVRSALDRATKAKAAQPSVQDQLAVALERAFGMTAEDAQAVAAIVQERFAGVEEVDDEKIEADVRSLFYTLEAKRLLSFRRSEYENDAGEKRRAFFWRIRIEVVRDLSAPIPVPANEDVYAQLPAECWRRVPG